MENKTKLDLSKYNFNNLPKVIKINKCNDYEIVTFDKIFDDIKSGDMLSLIGDEFEPILVRDVITNNIIILQTDAELTIGSTIIYRSDIIQLTGDKENYVLGTTIEDDDLIAYLGDRTSELHPEYKDCEDEKYETTVHPDLIKYFSKFSMEEQTQLVEALKKADILLDKGKTTIKNLELNKIFNKKEWDDFFNDIFNKINF